MNSTGEIDDYYVTQNVLTGRKETVHQSTPLLEGEGEDVGIPVREVISSEQMRYGSCPP